MNPFPTILATTRVNRGYKQGDLSELLNFSRVAIAQYESGRRTPNMERLSTIANFLKVPVSDLLLTDEEKAIIQTDGTFDRLCAGLKYQRKLRQITIRRLSLISGLPVTEIQRIEKMNKPDRPALESVLMLALSLRCSITELLELESTIPAPTPEAELPYSGASMVDRINSLPRKARVALSMYLDFLVKQEKHTD